MTAADPIAAYLSNLEHERRLSAHTLRGYTHELEELSLLAKGRPLESLTAIDIRGAVSRAHAGGLTARSISHRLSAWRAFYRWLAGRVDLPANPVATVRAPKQTEDAAQSAVRRRRHAPDGKLARGIARRFARSRDARTVLLVRACV